MRVLSDAQTFGLRAISGAMGGCPPPPPEPPPAPPPSPPSPSAEPHVVATPPAATTGRCWVEGAELHYIAANGVEYAATGTAISSQAGAEAGRFYIDGADAYYIDASLVKRRVLATTVGPAAPSAEDGRMWIEDTAPAGKQLQWIGGTTRFQFWNGV